MRAAALLLGLAACDPMWGAKVTLRDPNARFVSDATVAVACGDSPMASYASMAARTRADGTITVGSLGSQFPVGCDIFVAKPGYRTQRIAYRELCPSGPKGCERFFEFDLVLEPDATSSAAPLRSRR